MPCFMQTLTQCGKVTDLEHAPTCIDTWKSLAGQDEFIALGSYSGFISLHRIFEVYGEERTSSERSVENVVAHSSRMPAWAHDQKPWQLV